MLFCSSCGAQLDDGVAFCSRCGAQVGTTTYTSYTSTVATGRYSLVLLTTGTCPNEQADDIIQDLLGYTAYEAFEIVSMLPCEVAQDLNETQALYLAQAFTEYGMDVAVYNGSVPVDLSSYATRSVFKTDGNLLKRALIALATLTVSNRLKRFLRWSKPVPRDAYFVPRYEHRRPVHVRRTMVLPAPAPARPAVTHPAPHRDAGMGPQARPSQHNHGHAPGNAGSSAPNGGGRSAGKGGPGGRH